MRTLFIALVLLQAACTPTPSWYGVPAQHRPPTDPTAEVQPMSSIGEYMRAADANADQYIVKDVRGLELTWRWVMTDPEFRFVVKPNGPLPTKFRVELGVSERTFQDTGPLKLVFEGNGQEFGRKTLPNSGEYIVDMPVSPSLLRPGQENRVVIHVLNAWQAADPGVKLGFILKSAGFISK